MSEDQQDYVVGYKKPPRATRFKKGQSGNPKGRTPRPKNNRALPSGVLPTVQLIRAEAQRLVLIREGENRREISTSEAVLRALARTAIQGGVLAQRTYLELQMLEDERMAHQKRELFESWKAEMRTIHIAFARAKERGEKEPAIYPHPDDVRFDHSNLEVHVDGPLNREEADRVLRLRRIADLLYELSVFHEEDNRFDKEDLLGSRMGFFLVHWLTLTLLLPPRMRRISSKCHDAIVTRTARPRKWEAHLRTECEELDLPFVELKGPFPTWSLRELGIRL